jgi:short-subunit dehydrogenase
MICPGFVQTKVAFNALTGDGTPQNTDDNATSRGMPVNEFARKMIDAIARKKFEAYIGKKEVVGIYLKRFVPKVLHRVVLKSDVV